jgi:hypothetical protein
VGLRATEDIALGSEKDHPGAGEQALEERLAPEEPGAVAIECCSAKTLAGFTKESVSEGREGDIVVSANLLVWDMNPEKRLHPPVQRPSLLADYWFYQADLSIEGLLLARSHLPKRVLPLPRRQSRPRCHYPSHRLRFLSVTRPSHRLPGDLSDLR